MSFYAAAVPLRTTRRLDASSRRRPRRRCHRLLHRHADRPAAGGRARGVGQGHRRSGLPDLAGVDRLSRRRGRVDAATIRRHRRRATTSRRASAPRSSSARSPGYLHLRSPERDTVLYPSISYPTYAMGATLAGLRPVPVAMATGRLDLESIDAEDAARALVLWANSPSNPTGYLDDLEAIAAWGRRHGVLVASDECYAEFTWAGRPRSILEHGSEGVLAVHSYLQALEPRRHARRLLRRRRGVGRLPASRAPTRRLHGARRRCRRPSPSPTTTTRTSIVQRERYRVASRD